METEIWEKKTKVSYILSIFVLLIHFYPTQNFVFRSELNLQLNTGLRVLLRDVVAVHAVPLFFIMSGYFFFRNFEPAKYPEKMKSRFKSLVSPYLSWNIIMVFWQIFYPIINKSTTNEKYTITVKNLVNSIIFYGANFQFWFLFYLIIFVILSIPIWYILKNRYLVVFFILVVWLLRVNLIINDRTVQSILFFCTGAYLAIYNKKFFEEVNYKLSLICSIIFGAIVLIKFAEKMQGRDFSWYLETGLLFVATVCLWKVFDFIIKGIPTKKFMHHFFAIYALHPLISVIVSILIWKIWYKNEWTAFLYVVVCVGITLAVIELICIIMEKISRRFFNIIMGQRV